MSPFQKPTRKELARRFSERGPLTPDQADRIARVSLAIFAAAADGVELTPCCPEQARAVNKLDEAAALFAAAITRNE